MKNHILNQGMDENFVFQALKAACTAVMDGVSGSKKEFERNVDQYSFRCAKSVWRISHIKKRWKELYSESSFAKSIMHLRSYGADYYLFNGKVLICFKQMTSRSRVQGMNSKRFKDAMAGNLSKYSVSMINVLSKMGILKPLPIYYIGYILDYKGDLADVRIAHYEDNQIDFLMSLKNLTVHDLFSLTNQNDEIDVKPKDEFINKRKRRRKGGDNTPT